MDRLLHYVDQITRQRNRGQLEGCLTAAVHELLSARRVLLYKLFMPPGDLLVGLAAEADGEGQKVHDDGISWPEGTGSLDHHPLLRRCLVEKFAQNESTPDGVYTVFMVRSAGRDPFGFLMLLTDQELDEEKQRIIEGLLTVFRNCLALLDYSEIDTLTGLLNRKTFDEYLISILSHLANEGDTRAGSAHQPHRRRPRVNVTHHWMGVIDIDHFKSINDRFGHLIGDEVLILTANLMRSVFRSQDKLFRFGGEEFVVLLKPTEYEHALACFERYRREVENFTFPQVGHVTVSTGFTRIGLHDTPSAILDNADEALYWAKEHGRNRVSSYEKLIEAGELQKHTLVSDDIELF